MEAALDNTAVGVTVTAMVWALVHPLAVILMAYMEELLSVLVEFSISYMNCVRPPDVVFPLIVTLAILCQRKLVPGVALCNV